MCNGGRILHHLKYNLWRPETSVLIVGFQAAGTLWETLVERAETVRIFGETIAVRAGVHTLADSGSPRGRALAALVRRMAGSKPRVVVCHGEDKARAALADLLVNDRVETTLPRSASPCRSERRPKKEGFETATNLARLCSTN